MKVIITCGPSYEPIDGMRRITNASTGELGMMLADAMFAAGHTVMVFKGEMATTTHPVGTAEVVSFSTNDDLLAKLRQTSADAVFHAAALCDFRVKTTRMADGRPRRRSFAGASPKDHHSWKNESLPQPRPDAWSSPSLL